MQDRKILSDYNIIEERNKKAGDKMNRNKAAEDGLISTYVKGSMRAVLILHYLFNLTLS